MAERLLTVRDLKVHFPIKKGLMSRTVGRVKAVDGVSFHLDHGETLGIVGESGCGKTTTGQAVLMLTPPTSGEVEYKGRPVVGLSRSRMRALRREMQIIFQDPYSSLNPRLTVNSILSDPLEVHGLHRDERAGRIAFLLEKVGLTPEQGRRYPHEFSGGQRQRIGIARALALNPQLIIADEPVSALDVSIQAQIINLLIDLQAEFKLSYIVIAHDLAVVEHLCDRVAVMYLGKIVETGTYSDIYNDPKHPYTQALLSAVPVPDPDSPRHRIILGGDVPSPANPPPGCNFHPRCPKCLGHCHQAEPALVDVQSGHLVACYLYL
jgi:oligopeptide/dipeptide ABC transporter ATP-binding protein